MTVDVTQFYQTFFDESFEGLDVMESQLLNLDVGAADEEIINSIFRAAHSIKGGAATFGFLVLSNFTHVIETLLDEMRAGQREVTQEAVSLLLESVDTLREMLGKLSNSEELAEADSLDMRNRLQALLDGGATVAPVAQTQAASQPQLNLVAQQIQALGDNITEFSAKFYERLFAKHPEVLPLFSDSSMEEQAKKLANAFKLVATQLDKPDTLRTTLHNLGAAHQRYGVKKEFYPLVADTLLEHLGEVLGDQWTTEMAEQWKYGLQLIAQWMTENYKPDAVWTIKFSPSDEMLKTGNDPLRMFKELGRLGQLQIEVDSNQLPLLNDMDPEVCYLSWTLTLSGAVEKSEVEEVFEWVIDDCTLEISGEVEEVAAPEPLVSADPAPAVQASVPEPAPAAAPVAAAPKPSVSKQAETRKPAGGGGGESGSIRVSTDKIDALINMVGELVITQSMLGQLGEDFDLSRLENLRDGLAQLERNTRELQESVMRIRMLPISFAFQRFPRMVRDLSQKLNKSIELKLSGEQTELDKTVMEKIGDPLVHLVRNSIDHGIESPEVRKAAGKPETGTVHLEAYHQGGSIVIEITDDGAGLDKQRILEKAIAKGLVSAEDNLTDEQIHHLIFEPGFSTAQTISDVSGRGVGMDVVRRNIRELGGTIELRSVKGEGSSVVIRLPLTLAILDGQLIRVGNQTYIVPLVSIIESIQIYKEKVNAIAGQAELYQLREEYIPIVRLYEIFRLMHDSETLTDGLLVVVEGDGEKIGLFVDELLGQQQVVIKSLETNFRRVEGLSGATILGDGTVALILDIAGLIRLSRDGKLITRDKTAQRKLGQSAKSGGNVAATDTNQAA